jgi:hypothetical protein
MTFFFHGVKKSGETAGTKMALLFRVIFISMALGVGFYFL